MHAPQPTEAETTRQPVDGLAVHIDADNTNVRLFRYLGSATGYGYGSSGSVSVTVNQYADECRAPCDRLIAQTDQRFLIGGDGVTGSGTFVLADHAHGGQVSMKVKAGNAGAFFGGWVMAGLGGSALLGTAIGAGVLGSKVDVGAIAALLLGSALLTALGLVLGINNQTTVEWPVAGQVVPPAPEVRRVAQPASGRTPLAPKAEPTEPGSRCTAKERDEMVHAGMSTTAIDSACSGN